MNHPMWTLCTRCRFGTAGISAVDSRDIAEATAITLAEHVHEGKTYDLVSSSQVGCGAGHRSCATAVGRQPAG
jgi:hypothetical protein